MTRSTIEYEGQVTPETLTSDYYHKNWSNFRTCSGRGMGFSTMLIIWWGLQTSLKVTWLQWPWLLTFIIKICISTEPVVVETWDLQQWWLNDEAYKLLSKSCGCSDVDIWPCPWLTKLWRTFTVRDVGSSTLMIKWIVL